LQHGLSPVPDHIPALSRFLDNVIENQWRVGRKGSGPHMEEEQGSASFQPMERLLGDWLAGARLPEVLRVVQLIKAELSRRGVVLSWSVSQVEVEGPCPAGKHEAGA
jgi:hypothetical protein